MFDGDNPLPLNLRNEQKADEGHVRSDRIQNRPMEPYNDFLVEVKVDKRLEGHDEIRTNGQARFWVDICRGGVQAAGSTRRVPDEHTPRNLGKAIVHSLQGSFVSISAS